MLNRVFMCRGSTTKGNALRRRPSGKQTYLGIFRSNPGLSARKELMDLSHALECSCVQWFLFIFFVPKGELDVHPHMRSVHMGRPGPFSREVSALRSVLSHRFCMHWFLPRAGKVVAYITLGYFPPPSFEPTSRKFVAFCCTRFFRKAPSHESSKKGCVLVILLGCSLSGFDEQRHHLGNASKRTSCQ